MNRKSELKLKYKKLKHEGKHKEAQKFLEEKIWNFSKDTKKSVEKVPEKKEVKKKSSEKSEKKISLDSLTKIKGIGKKTVEDIKKIYSNVNELKEALKKNDVPLRDDICKKLNKELN